MLFNENPFVYFRLEDFDCRDATPNCQLDDAVRHEGCNSPSTAGIVVVPTLAMPTDDCGAVVL
jgi:hypothetical protein